MDNSHLFPVLRQLVEQIAIKNPFQRKSLQIYLSGCQESFLVKADWYLKKYLNFLNESGFDLGYVVDAYNMMAKDILVEQALFKRKGCYRYNNLEEVIEKVYSNSNYMHKYIIGVAISQFLWKNHRDMFLFFSQFIRTCNGERYLEIGPGHGLFFVEAALADTFSEYHAIDISPTSFDITKSFVKQDEKLKDRKMSFLLGDITKQEFYLQYDFITMGEVLEHVEKPKDLLLSVWKMLKKGGKAYISTCANAPVVDHIYLYKTLDAIRKDLSDCGLVIVKELSICNENIPQERWDDEKANLSYACLVEKK
jgi:2-polyprenyl-3-methyl-5-hydroxy-6-metoxy-1,4-benzoquinol methylase